MKKEDYSKWTNCLNLGQEWCLCPHDWNIEEYVTIESSAGKLILVDHLIKAKQEESKDVIKQVYVPIKKSELKSI